MAEYTRKKVIYRLGVAPYALQDSWINKNDFRKSGSTRKQIENTITYMFDSLKIRKIILTYFILGNSTLKL